MKRLSLFFAAESSGQTCAEQMATKWKKTDARPGPEVVGELVKAYRRDLAH